MNTVRTTVSLDENLHRQLMAQAFSMGKSFSEVINLKLKNANFGIKRTTAAEDLAFFRKLGKKTGKTDWTKLIREERDR